MMSSKLGLPFTYQQYPAYFDTLDASGDDGKNIVIDSLLKKHGAETVFDMTCGTGAQAFYLAKRGYQVVGSDFSPDLLKIARKKEGAEVVSFVDGDMRPLHVGIFDAVITIANAIGHLTKDDFEKAMRNIGRNLKDGGTYIFDIFNLQAMTDAVVADLAMHHHKKLGNTRMYATQCSTIDRDPGLLTSYDHCMIQTGASEPKRIQQVFTLQIYTLEQLREMLKLNGLRLIEQYAIDGSLFQGDKSTQMFVVAQKV